jgi:hypothetical protein
MKSRITRWTTMTVVLGVLAALAPTVAAQTQRPSGERSIEDVKQRCINAIDDRLHRIDRLQNAVSSSRHVTARHEAVLEGQLAEAQAGLTRLKAQIRTEDNREELKGECKSIVEDFRIYVLVTPAHDAHSGGRCSRSHGEQAGRRSGADTERHRRSGE